MSSTTEHQGLFSWLTNSRHHNDKEAIDPKPIEENKANNIELLNHDIDEKLSLNTEKAPTSLFSRHFKGNNLMHFHRPHGLFHKLSTSTATEVNNKNNDAPCSCKNEEHRHSGSTNDADDEDEGDSYNSRRSRDGTLRPPCMCEKHDNTSSLEPTEDHDDNIIRRSRENSIFTLPEDVDSPDIGFKKLKQDGDLVDYSDICIVKEEELYQDDKTYEIRAKSRSVIRNDLISLAFNGPFQSPITTEKKQQVLHVGCGNGAWCVEMAESFPNWLVVGIDDKTGGPIQDQRKVPKNFKYIRCYYDVLRTLKDIPSDSFDLVLCRFMIYSYCDEGYKDLIIEIKRICKPGGYAEFNELDMRIYGNPKAGLMTHKLNAKVFRTMETNKLNPRLARKLTKMVSHVFNVVPDQDSTTKTTDKFHAEYTSLPLGVWGGKLGVMFRDDINDLFEYFQINPDEASDSEDDSNNNRKIELSGSENESINDPFFYENIETMEEELETQKSFMNLYHVYIRKNLIE